MPFEIEFLNDEDDQRPCEAWMDRLDDEKLAALIGAINAVLSEQGIGVCATPFGKQLGQGLAEFRVRRKTERADVLLRVFFHAYGDRKILLVSGYDKGLDVSEKRQQKEIARARRLLKAYRESRR